MTPHPQRVYGFSSPYEFLSNFHLSSIVVSGIRYPTVEHAFAAAKTCDENERRAIAAEPTPGRTKRHGRRVALRPDWEAIKSDVMLCLVRKKFRTHPDLAAALLETGSAELVEANTWHDQCWGVDRETGIGENRLGAILMRVRSEIAAGKR